MSSLLAIHILAAALAILLGAVALIVRKGGKAHRKSGMLFVFAMVVMAATAALLELLQGVGVANLVAAILTMYFVGTALTTVRPATRWTTIINIATLALALLLAVAAIAGGVGMIRSEGLSSGGVPHRTIGFMSFVLAAALLLSAAGDIRVLRSGPLRGGPRLARHLWRMCFALFIAAGSFFSIRERVARLLPDPFTSGPMRLLPIVLLFATMFYWLWRVRRRPVTV